MCSMPKIKFEKIAVLTSRQSWFVPYSKKLVGLLNKNGFQSQLFHKHEDAKTAFDVVFILSYFNIIDECFLERNKHNLVVHESALPQGKGWAPLFWQILEGNDLVPIVLFEATKETDAGDIYIQDNIILDGSELHDEIRSLQAEKTVEMCLRFLEEYDDLRPVKQTGKETFYPRRTSKDSLLGINKSIAEQFDLLRIVNNDEFPAFFNYRGHKYILKIVKE